MALSFAFSFYGPGMAKWSRILPHGENESSKCPDHRFSFIFISVHKSQKFLPFLKAKKSTVPRLVSRLRDNKKAALASSPHTPF